MRREREFKWPAAVILFAAVLSLFLLDPGIKVFAQSTNGPVQPPAGHKFDGCSMFPDGDYGECCEAHDRDYFIGGTSAERKASDKRLRDCVRAKGHKYIAPLMYLGVRIGGVSWLPTPFKWGFGQPKNSK